MFLLSPTSFTLHLCFFVHFFRLRSLLLVVESNTISYYSFFLLFHKFYQPLNQTIKQTCAKRAVVVVRVKFAANTIFLKQNNNNKKKGKMLNKNRELVCAMAKKLLFYGSCFLCVWLENWYFNFCVALHYSMCTITIMQILKPYKNGKSTQFSKETHWALEEHKWSLNANNLMKKLSII